MNAGLLPGIDRGGWQRYEPKWLCAGAGGETQPVSSDEGTYPAGSPGGRYLVQDNGLVVVTIGQTLTGSNFSWGAGSAYVFSLPKPALRWTGAGASSPVPLGISMSYFSFTAPAVTLPLITTLADPFPSLNGREDNYIQCYCPTILSWGGPSQIVTVDKKVTITHRLGYTPRAEDIEITFVDALNVGSTTGPPSIQAITSTTFDVVIRTGDNPSFNWKVKGKPPTGSTGSLLSPTVPWDWTRANNGTFVFGNMFLHFSYESRP